VALTAEEQVVVDAKAAGECLSGAAGAAPVAASGAAGSAAAGAADADAEGGGGGDGSGSGHYRQYEYLDHTADIQIHAWGYTMAEAFEQVTVGMFGYMTELDSVEVDDACTRVIEAKGHDMLSLLYSFMDEFLYLFCGDEIAISQIDVLELDTTKWTARARGRGEAFDLDKHPQGTEIKAITYSNMSVNVDPLTDRVDIYVIVDI
jgi:SHS2 domain-containing protein